MLELRTKQARIFRIEMKVHNPGQQHSVIKQFMAEIKDNVIQKDSLRFRRNPERVGEIMAYEFSKTFAYGSKQ